MRETIGEHSDGTPIERLTIESDRLSAELLTLGSILDSVRLDRGPNMTAPHGTPKADASEKTFVGPVCGPVVNRLTLPVGIDGTVLPLTKADDNDIVLHSGEGGTHDRVWQVTDEAPDSVTLAIDLADGLGGFPGNRRISVAWRVSGNELSFRIEATTDAPTLMNVAHHPYWALDGAGREGQLLASPARRHTPTTATFIPTGEILPVGGSAYDFTEAREPEPGLDANLCIDDAPSDSPRPAATLASAGGLRLDILTTAPGLQVFTGKSIGIALEPQLWPNAPAHPRFPSMRLDPAETFRQETIYRFSKL